MDNGTTGQTKTDKDNRTNNDNTLAKGQQDKQTAIQWLKDNRTLTANTMAKGQQDNDRQYNG